RDHRDAETFGHIHQADRLAIAFGLGHAEIMLDAALRIRAFFMADKEDGAAPETPYAAYNGRILAENTVARERREIFGQSFYIIPKMRAGGMARHLDLLPGRQRGVSILKKLRGLLLKLGHLVANTDRRVLLGEKLQLLHLAFQFCYRLLEVEIGMHRAPATPARTASGGAGNQACYSPVICKCAAH